jgi:hypothetical protein
VTVRYVLHAGPVVSQNDGDTHFVSASDLARLYRLKPGEYVVAPHWRDPLSKGWKAPEGAIHLRPRRSGNYSLPPAS